MRTVAAVCLVVWTVAVWTASDVEGTSAAPQAVQAAAQPFAQADIDKGRTTVTQVCVGCHNNGAIGRMVAVRKKTADEWRDTVYRMIGRGAQVLPDEIEPLTAYLTTAGGQGRAAGGSAAPAAERGGGRRGAPAAAGDGPAGDATAILAQRCQLCHDLATATRKPASGASWASIIDRMVTLGAAVTPAEHQVLITYLNARQQ
jgi:cytochrome c2